jgi:hypothetical protein
MLINNTFGTFVVLEDKIFHVETGYVVDTGPISEEELKEVVLKERLVLFKKNGEYHRDNDLPAVFDSDGSRYWYQEGRLTRWEWGKNAKE